MWPLEDYLRERTNQTVAAHVELVHQFQPLEALWDDSAEPVGVQVEQRHVGHQRQLRRKVTRNVAAVEVEPRNDAHIGVVECRGAEYASVGTHIGANPVSSEVMWIGIYSFLQGLKTNISLSQPVVCEGDDEVEFVFEVVREISVSGERQELALSNEGSFGICQGKREGKERRENDKKAAKGLL